MGQARKRGSYEERRAEALARETPRAMEAQPQDQASDLQAVPWGSAMVWYQLKCAVMVEGAAPPRDLAKVESRYTKRGRGGW